MVRKEVFRSTPSMNPAAEFPVKEITGEDVWERLRVQVFMVTSGVRQCQAFVISCGRAYPLGIGFGGDGVLSMCVADLSGDGKPKLFFSYSWGSGMHRSLVAIWTGGAKWLNAKPMLRDYDLRLEKVDDEHVEVMYGEDAGTGKVEHRRFGRLRLSDRPGGLELGIEVDPHLPADVSERLWR
jgi:hypothetical protein